MKLVNQSYCCLLVCATQCIYVHGGSSTIHAASRVRSLSLICKNGADMTSDRHAAKQAKKKTGKGAKIRTLKYLWLEVT